MDKKIRLSLYLAIGLLAIIPIAAVFYVELGSFSEKTRMLAAACSTAIIASAAYLMRMHIFHLSAKKLAVVISIGALGIFLALAAIPFHLPFEMANLSSYLLAYGKVILIGLAFLSTALFAVSSHQDSSPVPIPARPLIVFRLVFPYLILISALTLVAYFSESRTLFVYFWDYRNYWQKTEVLHELLASGHWKEGIRLVAHHYSADYSLLPAVIPAILGLFVGYPSRLNYLLVITCIYAVPAYIVVAYLAKRLLDGDLAPPLHRNSSTWIYSSLPVFIGIPIYFGTTLYLMPDIGGVILFVAALLQASSLMRAIADVPEDHESWKTSTALLRSSLGLGILFSLMFLFRRWYIFAAIGIACSCIMLVFVESWVNRKFLGNMVRRASIACIYVAFSALPFFSWILFDWSHNAGRHDYLNLYSSYKNTFSSDLGTFIFYFGVATSALCIMFIILTHRLNINRRLIFILITSSIIATLLFLKVQSPGRHHFYLLMPLLGASLAALSMILFRLHGLFTTVLFSIVLLLGNGVATWSGSGSWVNYLFAKYADWLPKEQRYAKGFDEIAKWLISPENEKRKFCVIASSAYINQSIFNELWQIVPELKKNSFDGRLISLGQVDSQNGPPADSIKQCDISLVGLPFQTHLKTGEQFSLQIIQEELLGGAGIGAAFERVPREFLMDGDTKIIAYHRTREITDKEYAGLVERFLKGKGPSYVVPPH